MEHGENDTGKPVFAVGPVGVGRSRGGTGVGRRWSRNRGGAAVEQGSGGGGGGWTNEQSTPPM